MNPQADPSMMLPPQMIASMVRNGGQPGQIFQQNPLSTNMTPDAMGADPTVMNQPPMSSQAQNPTMPPNPPGMQAPAQPDAGIPGMAGQDPQLSESQYILNVLADRLKHHSKITEKTVSTLSQMIGAGLPSPSEDPNAQTA